MSPGHFPGGGISGTAHQIGSRLTVRKMLWTFDYTDELLVGWEMPSLSDDYSPQELEQIERMAQRGLEACAEDGFYLPYETHILMAELALMTKSVAGLTEKVEALIAKSKQQLETTEDVSTGEGKDNILSTF